MSFPKFVNMTKTYPFIFRYENRPYKYAFLHAFFLICPPYPFQNLSIWHLYVRLHIILKAHPKYVFFRYENRPYKYVFLHAFFLICPPCPYQNLSIWPKTHPLIFRYENRPYKYVFLHAFFLICPPCPFQNLSIWPKHTLLFSGMKIDLINMHFCMRFS